MIRTFKFRLFTNANQDRELAIMLETHRRLYNSALDARLLCYETAGVSLTFFDQVGWLTRQRKCNPWLAKVNSKSATLTLRKLDKAFRAFFVRGGHPRFKGKEQFNSFVFDPPSGGAKIVGRKLRVQHIGMVRVRWHRDIPANAVIKQITFSRQGGKWFVLFACEIPLAATGPKPGRIGIDVGLKSFVTTSDGESLGDSRTLESNLKELRVRQRELSRCKRGSNTRKQVKQGVTKLHAKVRNARADMHHKVSRSLVDRYGTIAAERLTVQGMLKNRRLSRRISDAGWYGFIAILTYKAVSAGGQVIQVDPRYTSQECSACGEIVPKSLDVRVHSCACGLTLDRDVNAARNILGRAVPEIANVGNSLH